MLGASLGVLIAALCRAAADSDTYERLELENKDLKQKVEKLEQDLEEKDEETEMENESLRDHVAMLKESAVYGNRYWKQSSDAFERRYKTTLAELEELKSKVQNEVTVYNLHKDKEE
jgi:hypothetical protein